MSIFLASQSFWPHPKQMDTQNNTAAKTTDTVSYDARRRLSRDWMRGIAEDATESERAAAHRAGAILFSCVNEYNPSMIADEMEQLRGLDGKYNVCDGIDDPFSSILSLVDLS